MRSEELRNPSMNSTLKTDLSPARQRHEGGLCREVLLAVCVTMPERDNNDWFREGISYHQAAMRTEGEVKCFSEEEERQSRNTSLAVPDEFVGIRYDWTMPSQQQPSAEESDEARLGACLKAFVSSMLGGVTTQLQLEAAEAEQPLQSHGWHAIDAVVRLSQDLTVLNISATGSERSVPIRSIRSVRPPVRVFGGLSWFQPSDRELMVILSLAGGRFVRLRFDQKDQAAYFGTCVRVLVKVSRIERQGSNHYH